MSISFPTSSAKISRPDEISESLAPLARELSQRLKEVGNGVCLFKESSREVMLWRDSLFSLRLHVWKKHECSADLPHAFVLFDNGHHLHFPPARLEGDDVRESLLTETLPQALSHVREKYKGEENS